MPICSRTLGYESLPRPRKQLPVGVRWSFICQVEVIKAYDLCGGPRRGPLGSTGDGSSQASSGRSRECPSMPLLVLISFPDENRSIVAYGHPARFRKGFLPSPLFKTAFWELMH